jgi:hypothetical protein
VTNVLDPETWGSAGGSGTLRGHFFVLFFGVGSGSEPVPGPGHPGTSWMGDRDHGSRPRHRSRTHSRDSSSVIVTSIVDTRSHSDLFRVRSEIASKLDESASSWHKDNHEFDSDRGSNFSTPPHDLRSLGAIANFVRRSRKFSASSIDLRSLRDRSDLASSDTFARANVMSSFDRTRSISELHHASARKKFPRIASTMHRSSAIFFVYLTTFSTKKVAL